MPRKKGPSGRGRKQLSLGYVVERTNKKLYKLEKESLNNRYAGRHLTKALGLSDKVTINRKKGSKQRIKVSKHLNMSEKRYLNKRMQRFLKAQTSTIEGIMKTRENVRKGFSKLVDKQLEDEDLDLIYDILEDPDFKTLHEKVGDSDLIKLIYEFKEMKNQTMESFKKLITDQKMTANTKETQDAIEKLYKRLYE